MKRRGREVNRTPKKDNFYGNREINPIGVLIIQAFDLYLPWMSPDDIAYILHTGSLPPLAVIAGWEVARSVYEACANCTKNAGKTANKPQRENGVQIESDVINW